RQPIDADMNVGGRFLAARDVKLAATWRAGAHEHRVPAFCQQRLEAVDALAAHEFDAEIEDVIAFLVDDRLGQPEARDLGADHPARLGILVEPPAGVAERREAAGDRERGRAAAHKRNALAVRGGRPPGQAALDVVLVVCGHALEPADRPPVLLDATAPAGRLAGPGAGAPEKSREHIPFPIYHVSLAVTTRRAPPAV